jgi:hypothetical protein
MFILVAPKPKLDERIASEERTRLSEGVDEDDLDAEAMAVKTMLLANFDCDFIEINCVADFAFVVLKAPDPLIPRGPEALETKPLSIVVAVRLLFQSLSSDAVMDVFWFCTFDELSLTGILKPNSKRESATG